METDESDAMSDRNPLVRAVIQIEGGSPLSVVGRPLGGMTTLSDDQTVTESYPIEVPDPRNPHHGLLISQNGDVIEFYIAGPPDAQGYTVIKQGKRTDIRVLSFTKIW